MNNNNKRNQVCGLDFIPLSEVEVLNMPGNNVIRLSGSMTKIPISTGEFIEESTNGTPVKQTLSAVVTDTGRDNNINLRSLLSKEGILIIHLTNGDTKVVGTDEFPVLITLTQSGSPSANQLTFDRDSPEPAKFLQSF